MKKSKMKQVTVRLDNKQYEDLKAAADEMTRYLKATGNPLTLERFVILLIELGIYSAEKVKDGNIELGIAEAMLAAEKRGAEWRDKHLEKTVDEALEWERGAMLITTAKVIPQEELDAAGITITISDKVLSDDKNNDGPAISG